jgi:hypothetical protein
MVQEKADQLYVSPSATYPLLGQNTRATINGCNNTGGFIPASHTMFYGFNIERMNSYVFAGTSFGTFRNNSWDNHFTGSAANIEWTCHGGDTNTTIDWNTFNNGSGHDNSECSQSGANGTNYRFTHNAMHYCQIDCVGPTNDSAVNEEYSYNLFDRAGQNCNGCGTGSAIEIAGGNRKKVRYVHNYIINSGGWALSIIGGAHPAEVAYNYCGGPNCFLEWDPHVENGGAPWYLIHHNYFDQVNMPVGGGLGIGGPYSDNSEAGGGGNQLYANRLIPGGSANEFCVDLTHNRDIPQPCYGVRYRLGSTHNPGVPAPPAAGSAP